MSYRDRFLPAMLDALVPSKVKPLNSVARGDIRIEKMGANPLRDKGETERQSSFDNLMSFSLMEIHIALLIHFVKICQ